MTEKDHINPDHYKYLPLGFELECIEYTRHAGFCQGNACKYIYRAGMKDVTSQELNKILWYNRDNIEKGGLIADFREEHPDLLAKVDRTVSPRAEIFWRILATDFAGAVSLVTELERAGAEDLDEWPDLTAISPVD